MVRSSPPSVKGGVYEVVLVASNFVRSYASSPDRVQAGRFLFSIRSDHGNQTVAQAFEGFGWERTVDRHRRTSCHWAFYSLSVHHYVHHVESIEENREFATNVGPMVISLMETMKSFESHWSTPSTKLTGSKVLGSRNMG